MVMFLWLVTFPAKSATANLILNGDFETNSTSVARFNVPSTQFSTYLPTLTEFGAANEIDINDGGFGQPPESGHWKLSLHTQSGGAADAFSFSLSAPLTAGVEYNLLFYSILDAYGPGNVVVGLSNSRNVFGTQIFAPPAAPGQWTLYSTTFVAPANASYLTVQSGGTSDVYVSVDNFTLGLVPEPRSFVLLVLASGLTPLGF